MPKTTRGMPCCRIACVQGWRAPIVVARFQIDIEGCLPQNRWFVARENVGNSGEFCMWCTMGSVPTFTQYLALTICEDGTYSGVGARPVLCSCGQCQAPRDPMLGIPQISSSPKNY